MDYLPLSMLNTLVYCERRYYLEHVEQILAKNEYIQEGTVLHRNIVETAKPGRPYHKKDVIHTKSLTLSSINESDEYKIIGVIDLIEEKEGKIYPVEYKHGKKPSSDTVWENDAIQLCAEAFLIEENLQIAVEFGYLFYYRSRERIKVQFTDQLRQKTKKYICRAYELYQSKTIPPPLDDSPKCPGCSLFPICMPDEVSFLRKFPNSENLNLKSIHRVVPDQISGGVVYLQSKGGYVRKQGHHLVYFTEEEEEKKIPLEQISQVVVFGQIQLTTQTISVLLDLDIPTFFLSAKGRFKGALFPAPTRNSNLRLLQYRAFDNPEIKLLLSKEIVKAKILNTRTLYMRSIRNQEPEDQTQIETSDEVATALKQFSEAIERANSLDTLLGLEGAAARIYFSNFSKLLRFSAKELGFSFEHRNRRPPVDPVNALLSLAYSLLAKECFSAALTVGFDPYFGFYHGQRSGRPSLALDLMEEFRTVLADSVVLTLLNKQMLSLGDFIRWGQACYLSEMGRKKFFSLWEARKNTEVTHPVFGYKVCYSRVVEMQARMLSAFIKKDIPFYKAFTWR